MHLGTGAGVDVYSSEEEMVFDKVQMPEWIIQMGPDSKSGTWNLLMEVLSFWRGLLDSKGVSVRTQPRSIYFSDDQTESLGTVDLP